MFEILLYNNKNLIFIYNYKLKKKHYLPFSTKDENFKTFVIKSLINISKFLLKKKQNNFSKQLENQINDTNENNILHEKFSMREKS